MIIVCIFLVIRVFGRRQDSVTSHDGKRWKRVRICLVRDIESSNFHHLNHHQVLHHLQNMSMLVG